MILSNLGSTVASFKLLEKSSVIFLNSIKIFHLEYIVRFSCAPLKWKFIKSPLNIVDILAIIPYFLNFILEGFKVYWLNICRYIFHLLLIRILWWLVARGNCWDWWESWGYWECSSWSNISLVSRYKFSSLIGCY